METIRVNMTPCEDVQTIHASQNDGEARQWGFELHNNGDVIDASEITDQITFKAYKGGTEQILPENGAVPVTAPFVGDIKYPDATRNDQEFLYRQSPTEEDGNAKIKSIYGNTLVWNQLLSINVASQFVSVEDGVVSLSGTPTGSIYLMAYPIAHEQSHKYLFLERTIANPNNISFTIGMGQGSPWLSSVGVIGEHNAFYTSQYKTYLSLYDIANKTLDGIKFTCQIFDLSKMFGVGNEPTSVDEFTALFPKPFYDYCQGAMLSFGGRNVKFNQLVQTQMSHSFEAGGSNQSWYLGQIANIVGGHKYAYIITQNQTMASNTRNTMQFQYVNTDSTTTTETEVITPNGNLTAGKRAWVFTAPTDNKNNWIALYYWCHTPNVAVTIENPMFVDLSEMFGVGNEPSAEGFLELFADDYYEYTTGQYMNIGQPVSLKTTGKNILQIMRTTSGTQSGVTYVPSADSITLNGTSTGLSYYVFASANDGFTLAYTNTLISKGTSIKIATLPNDVTLNFRYTDGSYENGVQGRTMTLTKDVSIVYLQVNVAGPSFNNVVVKPMITFSDTEDQTFEPYTENVLPVPLDEFPNGMDGIGDVHDEKNETGYKKKIGFVVVDGSDDEYWGFQSGTPNQCYHRMVVSTTLNNPPSISNYANRVAMCSGLTGISYIIYSGELRISDMNGAIIDVASLRAWLQAHPLVVAYALQEPLENYSVVDLGTLNWHTGGTNTSGIVRMESSDLRSVIKKPSAGNVPAKILCNIYETKSADNTYTKNGAISLNTAGDIDVYDSNYNTSDKVSAFKQAMSGVYLLYEKENSEGFTTATLVTENGEVALANENGVLVGKCNSDVSADAGFIEGKIKLSDEDGDVYSNKIQIHVERSPQ